MSKVMLDTNILLDYIIPDRPESEYARLLMQGIAHQKHQGIVSASSLKDLYYVAAKSIGEQAARDWVCIFMRLCDVEELDVEICAIAAESDEPDFEDGCIRATAERAQVDFLDFLITRDQSAYARSWVKTYSARDFLSLFPSV